jgi:uncharacterized DUF497 family protein
MTESRRLLLFVGHTVKEKNDSETITIITARDVSSKEREHYENYGHH